MAQKQKIKKESIIENRPVNDLIIFGILNVEQKKEKCTFERLVKECFNLFPKSFGLAKYSKWPDTRKLDRPLRTLRQKKLVIGSPNSFFTLTEQGKNEAIIIEKILFQKKLF